MSPSTAPPSCSLTRTARIVPLTRPQSVTSCAMMLPWTITIDLADDRHVGADARAYRRVRRRLPPRRDDQVLLLHRPPHAFGRICRRDLILLRCFALEHVYLRFPPAFTANRGKAILSRSSASRRRAFYSPAGRTLRLARH